MILNFTDTAAVVADQRQDSIYETNMIWLKYPFIRTDICLKESAKRYWESDKTVRMH